ncbi:MAG: ferredoxin--NADP reductase [SAR202 cluster bacterium]|nr:ferredoxin--NADP reductase [SAR202 cluster bacterium]|tara:strand:- start:50716 stop:51459 length:744 start_codon:yes stop_codon:yes gene_type:complete
MRNSKRFITPKFQEVEIVHREDVTADLMKLWVEKPDGFQFKPGQYCTIGLNGVERAYSIVSAPHEENLELFVELVHPPDGVFTPMIWDTVVGDKVTCRFKPKGIFILNNQLTNHFLIATVTGIVPYISMIRDYIHKNEDKNFKFFIAHGASYIDEFVYDLELEGYAKKYPDLVQYFPTISRPNESKNVSWIGLKGRVNDFTQSMINDLNLTNQDTVIYVCGHPGMIENVKEKLNPQGFKVVEERFWK